MNFSFYRVQNMINLSEKSFKWKKKRKEKKKRRGIHMPIVGFLSNRKKKKKKRVGRRKNPNEIREAAGSF